MVEENVASHGRYPNVVQRRSAVDALKKVGVRKTPISASPPVSLQATPARSTPVTEYAAAAKMGDWPGTTARITGCVLGFGSIAVIGPLLVAASVVTAVGVAAQTLFHPLDRGARETDRKAERQGFPDNDLKSREYYDKLGQVHYHTRTYIRERSAQHDHLAVERVSPA